MRILLDECVDWRLLRDLPSHDVKTVRQMGWSETVNGALLTLAEQKFDVLVTTDKNLSFQQNVARFKIGVVVLRAPLSTPAASSRARPDVAEDTSGREEWRGSHAFVARPHVIFACG